jgi:hypothetical protein
MKKSLMLSTILLLLSISSIGSRSVNLHLIRNWKSSPVFKLILGYQGGKGAEIAARSPLQPRPSASQPLLHVVLRVSAQAGYKMEAFHCRMPPSFTQTRGQNWYGKIRLPFLPVGYTHSPQTWSKAFQTPSRNRTWETVLVFAWAAMSSRMGDAWLADVLEYWTPFYN